jgi:predicted dehydrogenase
VVWARRQEAAAQLAGTYDATVAGSFKELLDHCDAVAFAVPPDVQAALAPRAAAAGKHLLLEKPLAFDLPDAERLAAAVEEAGVSTLMFLTNRYTAEVRDFLSRVAETAPQAAQVSFVSGSSRPGEFFATPWRVERGALLDLGPHALDLLDATLGTITEITAVGDPTRMVAVTTRHESGLLGQAMLSITAEGADGALVCKVHTDAGPVVFDSSTVSDQTGFFRTIAGEFSETVASGRPHPLDVRRGLMLQRLVDQAERSLG